MRELLKILVAWARNKEFNILINILAIIAVIISYSLKESTITLEESFSIIPTKDSIIVEADENSVILKTVIPSLAQVRDAKYFWDNYLYEGIPPEGNYQEIINGLLIIPEDISGIPKEENSVYLFVHRDRGDIQDTLCGNLECTKLFIYTRPYRNYGENIYSWNKYEKESKEIQLAPKKEPKKVNIIRKGDYTPDEFLKTFHNIACRISKNTGMPVEFVLAHARHESGNGNSKLTKKSNNFHGIKCWTKKCGVNYKDDYATDRFKVYSKPEDSFWDYATRMKGDRYGILNNKILPTWSELTSKGEKAHCKTQWELARKTEAGTVKRWAHGLSALGYATDKDFAKKLIASSAKVEKELKTLKLNCP